MAARLSAPAGFYCFGQEQGGRLMGSLVDELQRREAAARAEAEELRGRIAGLYAARVPVPCTASTLLVISAGRPGRRA
jgi:hypothetical protein